MTTICPAVRAALFILALLLSACAGQSKSGIAPAAASPGAQPVESLARAQQAAQAAPRDPALRRDVVSQRDAFIESEIAAARTLTRSGQHDQAAAAYQRILDVDAGNSRANRGLEDLERARRLAAMNRNAKELIEAGKTESALAILDRIAAEHPGDSEARRLKRSIETEQTGNLGVTGSLNALYNKPISLEFRDASIQQAFEALARTTNINFVFDKDVRPDLRATLFLRQTYLEDAVNLLLASNRLEKKILNERSVLIYPAEPHKTKEYQDLVVRAFYLDHGDARQVAATIKTLLKIKEAIPDDKLNMIIVRDTPEAVSLAERIIALHEVPDAEVMLEVEVLEVSRTKLMELGIQWPAQLTLTPLSAAGSTTTTLADLKRLNDERIQAALGSASVRLNKTDGDVNLLANPRIRVRNKTKAKILIGDKVPIITTTSTTSGFVSESVQYVDVGLKLDVEPRVGGDDDVSIKVNLEVSSLAKEIRSPGGTVAYQIGTRNADTLLKLRDGETQILAGLLNDEERSSGNRIPFLGDIPLLGRLFGSQKDERSKTEIILSITPRIIQAAGRPSLDAAQFWSGSENALRTRPLVLASANRNATQSESRTTELDLKTGRAQGTPTAPDAKVQTTVALSWNAPNSAKVGEVTMVGLVLSASAPLSAMPFQIGFDPAAVEVVKVEDGGFFAGRVGTTALTSNIDLTTGKIFANASGSSQEGRLEGVVALLHLRARSADKPIELRLLDAAPAGPKGTAATATRPSAALIPVLR